MSTLIDSQSKWTSHTALCLQAPHNAFAALLFFLSTLQLPDLYGQLSQARCLPLYATPLSF